MVGISLAYHANLELHADAQTNSPVLSVANATQNAAQLGLNEIRVRGHFWWGKEGSMIYDSYFKTILIVQYSSNFNKKHPGMDIFLPQPRRKSNIAIITGQLQHESDGRLFLIADDIEFTGERKL